MGSPRRSSPSPSVSICIPAFNAADWIAEALDSALSQSYADLEILVVDDASADQTLDVVRRRDDPRLRIEHGEPRVGAVANHNRCVALSRGRFVKFLHQDDLLYPECVERMVEIFEAHPDVGLVFSPRDIVLEDPSDPRAVAWKDRYGTLHGELGPLEAVNPGDRLLQRYLPHLSDAIFNNWIGEPSAVMVRRAALERVGLFNLKMVQAWDVEMWLRIMAAFDVGFVGEHLSAFRHHSRALSASVSSGRRDWLDLLWLYEGLLRSADLRREDRELLERYRRRERLRALKRLLARLVRRDPDFSALADYAWCWGQTIAGEPPPLHGALR